MKHRRYETEFIKQIYFLLNPNYTMFFVFNRVEAGHMAAGPGRSIPPPALDTGDKVGTSTRFITALAIFSS